MYTWIQGKMNTLNSLFFFENHIPVDSGCKVKGHLHIE